MGQLMGQAGGAQAVGSMLFTGLGALSGAAGSVAQGSGAAQSYNYQAQVAANNAAIARTNAEAALSAGSYAESISKLKTGQVMASQKVAQAANGLDVNIGSAVATRESTATVGAMDAAMIHFNAAREAYGLETQAANLDQQSELYSKAAKNSKKSGGLKAFTTLVAGASSLSSKWDSYKMSAPVKSGRATVEA